MDGFTFAVDSIGCSVLSKPTTGVGALQQPIKDLYLKFKKPGGPPSSKKVILRISERGLSVASADGSKGDTVHDLNSVAHVEAVKFTLLSGNDKKMRAMFLPLNDTRVVPVKDKNVFSVDKCYQFFKQINHPPLLACVLRRPRGVKSLDCHVFVMETADDALQAVSIINQFDSGGYSMEYIGDRPKDGSFNRGQRSDVIRTEYGEYSVYTGSKFDPKEDYFRHPDGAAVSMRPQSDNPSVDDHDNYGWNYRRVVSLDDGWQRDEGGQYSQEEQYVNQSRPPSTYDSSRLGYNYQRPDSIVQQRHGSSGSGEARMSYNEPSDRGRMEENIDRGHPFQSGRENQPSHNADVMPTKIAERPHKFENINRPMPLQPPSPQIQQQQQQQQKPLSPRGRESPRSPTGMESPRSPHSEQFPPGRNFQPPLSTPSFSMSNREYATQKQTSIDESPRQKPVAKVPPHLMTGVKVLPTDFSAIKLKTRSPKSSFDEDDHGYDNNVNAKAKLKVYRREEEDNQNRAYQYTDSTPDPAMSNNKSQQPIYSDESYATRIHNFSPDYVNYDGDDRRYIEQCGDENYGMKQRQQYEPQLPDMRGGQNRLSAVGHGYEPPRNQRRDNLGRNEKMSSQSNEVGGRPQYSGRPGSGYDGGQGEQPPPKKDAEIASMFTNLYVHREPATSYPQTDTNFEHTLGYYP